MNILGLDKFLDEYPMMALEPIASNGLLNISGAMYFDLVYKDKPRICPSYRLSIFIPEKYPKELPVFHEIGGAIPKSPDFHVNEADGSLCLGSPIRLKMSLSQSENFYDFCENFLNPYIYAVSLKLSDGVGFIFGELEHGSRGEIYDYREIFGVFSDDQVIDCLIALSKNKIEANKMRCPCGCGRRLAKCWLHLKINLIRKSVPREYFIDALKRHCVSMVVKINVADN